MAKFGIEGNPPRRLAVIGPLASGKTSFALRAAGALGLPIHHLDDHYWLTGAEPSAEEWQERERRLASGLEWVIDGEHPTASEGRLARAHAVVWLDYSAWRLTFRILRRWWKTDVDARLWKQLRSVWRYPIVERRQTSALIRSARGHVYRLRRPRDARKLLRSLEALKA